MTNPGTDADGARLAEEIRLLVDLLVERARPWLDSVLAAGHGRARAEDAAETDSAEDSNGDAADAHGGSAGEWCPWCAVVALARGERVEGVVAAARVLEHLTHLLALLRAVLADRWVPQDGVHMPGFRPPPSPPPDEGRNRRVQHVVVQPSGRWDPDDRDRD